MFEFFFKYPSSAFSKGDLVFLAGLPVWVLWAGIAIAGAGLGWLIWKRADRATNVTGVRPAVIWLVQTLFVSLLLLMLWQPALSIATLRPQQNIVAVVVDDSRSMALAENGGTRKDQAVRTLDNGLLDDLREKFQVRLYRAGSGRVERVDETAKLTASAPATRLGETLKQVVNESAGLPVGAIVLLSDGADNAGGIDLPTVSEIRRQRIPVHTIGFGREKLAKDIEIRDAQLPFRTLPESRLSAQINFRQFGYAGSKATLSLKEGSKVLASREVVLKDDGVEQTEHVVFNAGPPGPKNLQILINPLGEEENLQNNSINRMLSVDAAKPRILYIEGEPVWEYKFIRRAVDADKGLLMSSMMRTTQNQIYRQGIADPKELEQGFPAAVEELFSYQGLVIGGVESGYFTPTQQELIKQFVDRRGGGLLMLAGRSGLADGGYDKSPLAELLPVVLPGRKGTFRRDPANVQLTPAGRDSLLTRIE
ncbi:MAG: glutamine amidotransferase, partial [Bryobacteraceae bacterium]